VEVQLRGASVQPLLRIQLARRTPKFKADQRLCAKEYIHMRIYSF
jgi:hypothetical protein